MKTTHRHDSRAGAYPVLALFALALLLQIVALTGCTSTTYVDPQSGARFSRHSFLNRQSIGKVEMQAGDKKLTIEGYSNEQTEIAAAVAGSVAKALSPVK